MNKTLSLCILLSLLLGGCNSSGNMKESIKEALKEDPSILVAAIEANPAEIMEALQNAAKNAQQAMAKKREEEEQKKLEESYEKPLKPEIRKDELIRGTKGAPLVLVEYSDFECPFCSRAYGTVKSLLEKYEGKIQFIYKHLPLSFHPQAQISSQYFEAIRLQDESKAWKFHDEVYENHRKLKNGEKFLKSIAKEIGVDMKKLAKDLNSKKVLDRIEEDKNEAAKFGFQGTPGFLLNGIPVKGAYPQEHFEGIVEELKKRGKVNL